MMGVQYIQCYTSGLSQIIRTGLENELNDQNYSLLPKQKYRVKSLPKFHFEPGNPRIHLGAPTLTRDWGEKINAISPSIHFL